MKINKLTGLLALYGTTLLFSAGCTTNNYNQKVTVKNTSKVFAPQIETNYAIKVNEHNREEHQHHDKMDLRTRLSLSKSHYNSYICATQGQLCGDTEEEIYSRMRKK